MVIDEKHIQKKKNFAFLAFYCVLYFIFRIGGIINLKGNQLLLKSLTAAPDLMETTYNHKSQNKLRRRR